MHIADEDLAVLNYFLLDRRRSGLQWSREESIDVDAGYPPLYADEISDETLWYLYRREPIASRVVEIYAKECWQVSPSASDADGVEGHFAKALALTFGSHLRNWDYYCYQLDVACGIGRYAIAVFVTDGDESLEQPARPGETRRLIDVKIIPSRFVTVEKIVDDTRSLDFGMPEVYRVALRLKNSNREYKIHRSWCVHVIDDHHHAAESEYEGVPRLLPVLNRVLDVRKIMASAGEGYYRAGIPGLVMTTESPTGGRVQIDRESLQEALDNFYRGLQRYMVLRSLKFQQVSPSVLSPAEFVNAAIEQICVKLGCPKRVFIGSERGELASTQDDAAWNDRLKQRQHVFVTNRIIKPFLHRLVKLGVLPQPRGEITVQWPDLTSYNFDERVKTLATLVQAMATYIGSGVSDYLGEEFIFRNVLGLDEATFRKLKEAAAAAIADMDDAELEGEGDSQ